MKKLFISDLHLHESKSEVTFLFKHFLNGLPTEPESKPELYILGDLFDFWIGDDYEQSLYSEIIQQLRILTDAGIKTYLMHGNRDFLIGSEFLSQTGIELLEDPTILSIHNKRVMLSHGDLFCIDDTEYQKYKQMVRNQQWQQDFLSLTVDKRLQILGETRDASIQSQQNKPIEIMDINQEELITKVQNSNTDVVIHGHTHRPNQYKIEIGNRTFQRLVLGDWTVSSVKIIEWIDTEPKLIDLIN
jgi:UDP-2,3-diacylglucosamine hydrolase